MKKSEISCERKNLVISKRLDSLLRSSKTGLTSAYSLFEFERNKHPGLDFDRYRPGYIWAGGYPGHSVGEVRVKRIDNYFFKKLWFMTSESTKKREDEIDLVDLIRPIIQKKRGIIRITSVFAIIGIIVALTSETTYTADTTFIPQLSEEGIGSRLSGSLGGLSSFAGINFKGGQSLEFPPSLYTSFLENANFQLKLIYAPLKCDGLKDSVTYRDYYEQIHRPSFLSSIKKYTIGLPGLALKKLKSDEQTNNQSDTTQRFMKISLRELEHIGRLLNQVKIKHEKKDRVTSLFFDMPEPYLAAQMAEHLETLIHKELIDYKTNKVLLDLKNLESRCNERKTDFEKVQESLATFKDRNLGLNTEASRSELKRLESKYDLAFTIYTELARDLEKMKLKAARDTPLITIIKPIVIPYEKSGPKRVLIVFIFLFVGLAISIGQVFLVSFFKEFKQRI